MRKYDICCVGHITLDKIITPKSTDYMPGGTSYYFSHAINKIDDIDYLLVTAVGENELHTVEDLRKKGIEVRLMPSRHSVFFENIYGENQNNRTQRVLEKADPFSVDCLDGIEAQYIHLGALLADDFSLDLLKRAAGKSLVSVDSQGYLREVRDHKVYPVDWKDKFEALKYITVLKANEIEMEVLTGYREVKNAARRLWEWGVKEVLITLGSFGSVIYDGSDYYRIPAYRPTAVVDATGCGDTYTLGYLYQRSKGVDIENSGKFAAAMATLKIQKKGPFDKRKEDVYDVMENSESVLPQI